MRALAAVNKTPPGGFKYFVPETRTWIPPQNTYPYGHLALGDLLADLQSHYKANGHTLPSDISFLVQDQICASLPGGWCTENGHEVGDPMDPGLTLDFHKFKQGMVVFFRWLKKGFGFVDQAEADRRAQICLTCPWNRAPIGCTSCNMPAIHSMIDQVRGSRRTPYDSALNGCGICGCSLKTKIWFPLEAIRSDQTQKQKETFPGYCWAK